MGDQSSWLHALNYGVYDYHRVPFDLRKVVRRPPHLRGQDYETKRAMGRTWIQDTSCNLSPAKLMAPNRVQRGLMVVKPNQVRVTILSNTHRQVWPSGCGHRFLCTCNVVGWSIRSMLSRRLILAALLTAVWRLNQRKTHRTQLSWQLVCAAMTGSGPVVPIIRRRI